jgi:hypothetical protein
MGMNEHGFLARFRETRALVIIREWKLKGSGVEALKSYSVTRQKTRKRMGFGHENWVKLGSFLVFKDALNLQVLLYKQLIYFPNWVRLVVFMFLGRKAD